MTFRLKNKTPGVPTKFININGTEYETYGEIEHEKPAPFDITDYLPLIIILLILLVSFIMAFIDDPAGIIIKIILIKYSIINFFYP